VSEQVSTPPDLCQERTLYLYNREMAPTARAHARPARRSEARERLLATASQLFYAEGINRVGVDRIVSESRVTLATFYRHFPGKQDLVVAYLNSVHDTLVARAQELTERAQGRELVRALGAEVVAEIGHAAFRGCAFIKAASEIEDPDGPVRQAVATHRRWYYDLLRRAFADAGHPLPANAARHFVMLRDGAVTAGHLDSTTTAQRTFKRGVEGLLRSSELEPAPDDA
jgi:AcrR family transcriptional regulator